MASTKNIILPENKKKSVKKKPDAPVKTISPFSALKKDGMEYISIRGAREHNLKSVDIDIPKGKLVVMSGLSGSGKSSLAFDTLYAEGQRRYVESLSSYARQFISQHGKPDVDSISGLSPAISIDQKTTSHNPRSTVATLTEIYDYVRLLYARIGIVYSPATGLPIKSHSASEIVDLLCSLPKDTKIRICAPIIKNQQGEFKTELLGLKSQGTQRVKIDGMLVDLDKIPNLDKGKKHNIDAIIDRIVISENLGNRLSDSVESALKTGGGIVKIDIAGLPTSMENTTLSNGSIVKNGDSLTYSESFSCEVSGFTLTEMEPRIFSFNSPFGACPKCNGLGTEIAFNISAVIPNQELSLNQGAIKPWFDRNRKHYEQILISLAKHYKFEMTTPFNQLPENIKEIILHGSNKEVIPFHYSTDYTVQTVNKTFHGVLHEIERWIEYSDDPIEGDGEKYKIMTNCHSCKGFRLKQESLQVKINNINVGELCALSIDRSRKWFAALPECLSETHNSIARMIIKEIQQRLSFLSDVGLNYLSLSRNSNTLSGGEMQRIRLASQIGSGLCGVIYVLDEPSIGLHQSDNEKLIETLQRLRDLDNSVIVIEHDEDTIMIADYLIDVGPGAGENGGQIIAAGTVEEVMQNHNSITGNYLAGRECIEVPRARRRYGRNQFIEVKKARANNLKNIDVKIPLGMFVVVTGVSGGGKSTLVIETIYQMLADKLNKNVQLSYECDEITNVENINKVIKIDQSPIGKTPRSNPATYTGIFSQIRDWFTALPESKARGYKPGRFSFNVKGGRCEHCQGDGMIKVEMHFLPDVYVKCDICKGSRYNKETLEIKYNSKSISDVLNMTVKEAYGFFSNIASIHDKIAALNDVGLSYIRIGQSATTLSGGEAQRVKLARELSKKSTGDTLYILDEPTTGLHSADIKQLLVVLHKLVDYGNSALIIEHNIDVIKTADYIVDIGPKGGEEGGYVVASGTPEEVAANPKSVTGPYIKKALERYKNMT